MENKMKISCILIKKSCLDNQWKIQGKDLYLRCSVQDYYIKFSESEVKKADIISRIDTPVTVIVEIIDGFWDDCVENRKGRYVRLFSLK